MPKKTLHPRLRSHVRKGARGQVWVSYYYDMRPDGEKDIPLGNDHAEAVRQWDELHNKKPRVVGTLQEAFNRWREEVLPTYESEETKTGYGRNLAMIEPVFGPATWDQVKLPMLKQYLKKRTAKTQGNREMSVLSIIWNWARGEGLTELHHPAAGMERSKWKNKEKARTFDVTDEIFDAIYRHAEPHLKDAMDLATATGMRVKDAVSLLITDHRGDTLKMKAGKTGKEAEYDLTQSAILPALIARRKAHKALHFGMLTKDSGAQVTLKMLQGAFNRARAKAIEECPAAKGAILRDMRKRASRLSGSVEAASKLLQHSSQAVTNRHYPVGEKLRPAR